MVLKHVTFVALFTAIRLVTEQTIVPYVVRTLMIFKRFLAHVTRSTRRAFVAFLTYVVYFKMA